MEIDLGKLFGAGLYEAEICYLIDHEWAVSAEDVLFRRTKLGLKLTKKQTERLSNFMQERALAKPRQVNKIATKSGRWQ